MSSNAIRNRLDVAAYVDCEVPLADQVRPTGLHSEMGPARLIECARAVRGIGDPMAIVMALSHRGGLNVECVSGFIELSTFVSLFDTDRANTLCDI